VTAQSKWKAKGDGRMISDDATLILVVFWVVRQQEYALGYTLVHSSTFLVPLRNLYQDRGRGE